MSLGLLALIAVSGLAGPLLGRCHGDGAHS
jgi:hypothetical protein